jgi:hypothetical protein
MKNGIVCPLGHDKDDSYVPLKLEVKEIFVIHANTITH